MSVFDDIRDGVKDSCGDGFDAIVEATFMEDPDAIHEYAKNGGVFTNERHPDHENLTHALFLAKTSVAPTFQAFHDAGGVFTDQKDTEGRGVQDILNERLSDARRELALASNDVSKTAEWKETASVLENTIVVYNRLVEAQGGLIIVAKENPLRPAVAKTDIEIPQRKPL